MSTVTLARKFQGIAAEIEHDARYVDFIYPAGLGHLLVNDAE